MDARCRPSTNPIFAMVVDGRGREMGEVDGEGKETEGAESIKSVLRVTVGWRNVTD